MRLAVFLYIVIVNIVSFVMYGFDKGRARKGERRISEDALMFIALIGGSAGAFAGMELFRHKTHKPKFVIGVPLMLILHVILLLQY